MTPKIDLVNVKVLVNGNEQTIKMERGTSFENKGGIFTAGENNGVLKMTNYQLQAFKAMANNYTEEGENGIVLSIKDIQEAQNKYKNGGFVADMSEFLPEGYKIERPKLTSAENMVQAYVTNGKETQSATLRFSFIDKINSSIDKDKIVKTENIVYEDMEAIKKTYSDGSYSIKSGNAADYYYEEFYPNGESKVRIMRSDYRGLYGNTIYEYEVEVYDKNGMTLYAENNSHNPSDYSEEDVEQKQDSEGRIIYLNHPNLGVFKVNYEKNVMTHIYHGIHATYKITNGTDSNYSLPNCDYSKPLSRKFMSDSGREIDLLKGEEKSLFKEINAKCKFVDDTYKMAE